MVYISGRYYSDQLPCRPELFVDEFGYRRGHPQHIAEHWFKLDWPKFLADHRSCLTGSCERMLSETSRRESDVSHFFRFPGGVDCLVQTILNEYEVRLCGPDPEQVREMMHEIHEKYWIRPKHRRAQATFSLVKLDGGTLETHAVTVRRRFPRSSAALEFNYGSDFAEWAQKYVRALRTRDCGLSIFQGIPGTGKTTFIRHLIHRLRGTHSFYYFPPSQAGLLSSAGGVTFLARLADRVRNRAPVMVFEDAEPLLQRRVGQDSSVSSLLNVTDGLGSDFLSPQIICTVNCDVLDLDPALLRPGRLMALRIFPCLGREHACRLAARLGKPEPARESTLAEIYGESPNLSDLSEKAIGFAS